MMHDTLGLLEQECLSDNIEAQLHLLGLNGLGNYHKDAQRTSVYIIRCVAKLIAM